MTLLSCKHADNGMCDYCMPLEPYDATYLETNKIKHMSLHAYLRKLMAGTARRSSVATDTSWRPPPLEESSFKVNVPCTENHAPYPDGICTKCQPSAITLKMQEFRIVDHVEFDTPVEVDTFLRSWRTTGSQRFGFLIGRYERSTTVALGVKAVVSAIYEPGQINAVDGVQLSPWPDPELPRVEAFARKLGLQCVGMIYTDLEDDGTRTGKVKQKRSADTFFLSGTEALFAADFQLAHSNPSKHAVDGKFGSKFVTVVLCGDEMNDVALYAYQVSNTLMAMRAADIVEADENPAVFRMRRTVTKAEATPEMPPRYVPEVFFRATNEYGYKVLKAAAPTFPLDYCLVTVCSNSNRAEDE